MGRDNAMKRLLVTLSVVSALIFCLTACRITINIDNSSKLEFNLKDDGTYSVSAGGAFSSTELTIPTRNRGRAVTEIAANGFSGITSLKTVNIPEGIKVVGAHAFEGCNGITSVTLPKTLKSIDEYAFGDCLYITDLEIPDSVERIGFGALNDCKSLKTLTLPFIGDRSVEPEHPHFGYIFGADSYEYQSNEIPRNLSKIIVTKTNNIPDRAFYNCKNITLIIFPTSLESIGESAFSNCTSLNNLRFHSGLSSIGSQAFQNCANLTKIHYLGTVEQWKAMEIADDWISGVKTLIINCGNGVIYPFR